MFVRRLLATAAKCTGPSLRSGWQVFRART